MWCWLTFDFSAIVSFEAIVGWRSLIGICRNNVQLISPTLTLTTRNVDKMLFDELFWRSFSLVLRILFKKQPLADWNQLQSSRVKSCKPTCNSVLTFQNIDSQALSVTKNWQNTTAVNYCEWIRRNSYD